jgi:hypothetical protein
VALYTPDMLVVVVNKERTQQIQLPELPGCYTTLAARAWAMIGSNSTA